MTRAPLFNIPQRGEQPTAFFRALSEADGLVRELEQVHELQCRISELEATPSLPARMRAAADTLSEVAALYGYPHPETVTWHALELRHEADEMEKP